MHQSSELWLKLAGAEVDEAAAALEREDLGAAIRLLRRAVLCIQYVTTQIEMLNQMDPWEYQQIRVVLGHSSGFDSPGYAKQARRALRSGAGRGAHARWTDEPGPVSSAFQYITYDVTIKSSRRTSVRGRRPPR